MLWWDDEATKTWMHITTSRSIPIDIPDLESRISLYMAMLPRALSAGMGEKTKQPRALTWPRLYEHAPLGSGRGCGLDLLCDMWSSELSIFGPASYERKSWG